MGIVAAGSARRLVRLRIVSGLRGEGVPPAILDGLASRIPWTRRPCVGRVSRIRWSAEMVEAEGGLNCTAAIMTSGPLLSMMLQPLAQATAVDIPGDQRVY